MDKTLTELEGARRGKVCQTISQSMGRAKLH